MPGSLPLFPPPPASIHPLGIFVVDAEGCIYENAGDVGYVLEDRGVGGERQPGGVNRAPGRLIVLEGFPHAGSFRAPSRIQVGMASVPPAPDIVELEDEEERERIVVGRIRPESRDPVESVVDEVAGLGLAFRVGSDRDIPFS